MKRSDFLKSLGLGSSGLLLPVGLIRDKPVKIYDNYIKGLFHYDFKETGPSLKEGDAIDLRRDGSNAYDSFAIEVYWKDHKLGYLPAYENIVLANMLETGVELHSFVSRVDMREYPANALAIEVYAHLVLPTQKLIDSGLATKRADDVRDIYRMGILE